MSSPTVVYDPSTIDFEKRGKHHYQVAFHQDSSYGYSLVPLTVINGLKDSPGSSNRRAVAAFGGTHGNEWEGQIAVKRLCADLDPNEMSGRVLLIPQLSESACVANLRISPLDNVNMNRAFPGNPLGTISYRIADFVKTRIFPQVQVVLDIHAGGNENAYALCTSFHDIADPKQRAEIRLFAELFDTPFILVYGGIARGNLTEEAENEGKITIGGEFGFAESASPRGIRHAYEGIKNVLRYCGILAGDINRIDEKRSAAPRLIEASGLKEYIPSPRAGIWEPAVELGADVRQGDLLGRLHDFSDHASAPIEIRAHRSGVVSNMYFPARIEKGITLYSIARELSS
ncbi:MAG TPA: succinylglutamate desuccinylase/aspartoacylase family protein [Terracidiphilus sp.]|nr:succinylglutamate desuccinylase/aspartoacylase family protein [Terracidiphilus sp.]